MGFFNYFLLTFKSYFFIKNSMEKIDKKYSEWKCFLYNVILFSSFFSFIALIVLISEMELETILVIIFSPLLVFFMIGLGFIPYLFIHLFLKIFSKKKVEKIYLSFYIINFLSLIFYSITETIGNEVNDLSQGYILFIYLVTFFLFTYQLIYFIYYSSKLYKITISQSLTSYLIFFALLLSLLVLFIFIFL